MHTRLTDFNTTLHPTHHFITSQTSQHVSHPFHTPPAQRLIFHYQPHPHSDKSHRTSHPFIFYNLSYFFLLLPSSFFTVLLLSYYVLLCFLASFFFCVLLCSSSFFFCLIISCFSSYPVHSTQ